LVLGLIWVNTGNFALFEIISSVYIVYIVYVVYIGYSVVEGKNDKKTIRDRLYFLIHNGPYVQAMETYAKISCLEGIFKRINVGRGLWGSLEFQEIGFLGELSFLLC
jgi:hypothetical protein